MEDVVVAALDEQRPAIEERLKELVRDHPTDHLGVVDHHFLSLASIAERDGAHSPFAFFLDAAKKRRGPPVTSFERSWPEKRLGSSRAAQATAPEGTRWPLLLEVRGLGAAFLDHAGHANSSV